MQDEPEKIRQLVYDWDMQLMMNDRNLETIEQVRQFMEGSEALEFRALSVEEKYNWIEEVLIRFKYHKAQKSRERSDMAIYREDYGLFPIAGVSANNGVQTEETIKADTTPKAPIPQEVYPSRCYVIGKFSFPLSLA